MKRLSFAICLSVFVSLAAIAKAEDAVPQFGFIADGWLSPVLTFPMDDVWHAFGYPEGGINYYTMGGPADASTPYWKRFNPEGDTYQLFAGAYVVHDFQFASEWSKPHLRPADITQSVARVIQLAQADYFAWNSAYGAPPYAIPVPGSQRVVKGLNGWFEIIVSVQTYSDLGAVTPIFPWVPPYSLYEDVVDPYQPVTLEAVMSIKFDQAHQNLLVVYGNTARYPFKDGDIGHTPLRTIADVLRMMAAVHFH